MNPKQNIQSIQALRGLAAILVVLFHYSITLELNPSNPIAIFLSHGWSGVDLFFIISGFIAAYTVSIQDKGVKSSLEYLAKRAARIIPLYYLVTLTNMGHSTESYLETVKSMLFIPLGGTGPDSLGPLYGGARIGQGWTLNYEMYFYFVVAISMAFGKAKWFFTSGFMILTVLLPVAIFGLPESYGFSGFRFDNQYISLMTNPIIFEFIMGILVYFIFKKMNSHASAIWYLFIAISIVAFAYNLYSPIFYISRITAWALTASFLMISLLKLEAMGKLQFNNFILKIGNISFSIYLLHEGVQGILLKLMKKISGNADIFSNLSMRFVLFSLSLVLTYYVSLLSYKYIERSLSNKFRDVLLRKIRFSNLEKKPV